MNSYSTGSNDSDSDEDGLEAKISSYINPYQNQAGYNEDVNYSRNKLYDDGSSHPSNCSCEVHRIMKEKILAAKTIY